MDLSSDVSVTSILAAAFLSEKEGRKETIKDLIHHWDACKEVFIFFVHFPSEPSETIRV